MVRELTIIRTVTMQNEHDIILESITDGVFTVDTDWRVTSFNRAAEEMTGIPREEALGQLCSYVFRASICESGCALRRTVENGEQVRNMPIYILKADGTTLPVSISTNILKDGSGARIGGVETFRDLSVEEELKREIKERARFEDIISRNHHMRELFALMPVIAESSSTVLIEGESGTGKELVCRAIHRLSPRREGPFVAVNCGALPDTLIESELFGHSAGAFTDAKRDRRGRFAQAEGGTILLDEIGDISPAMQVRLLRVLQERTYEPLGSETSVTADVRILAATNKNLADLVDRGEFRKDLYYRINVVSLRLPPLRDRNEDIPFLAEHFIDHFNQITGKLIEGLSDAALAALMNHDYPGNIRELENAIEHAFVVCPGGAILPRHLPRQFVHAVPAGSNETTGATLRNMEITSITTALRAHGNNRTAAARALGIHKSTLHRKIRRYGIDIQSTPSKQ